MDPARRPRYLQALGLEPWQLRGPAPAAPVGERIAEAPVSAPGDWEGLQAAVAACRKCRLCETRTNTVFGVGPRGAPLMVVGEGPGADEDAQGEPFVGRAGQLLNAILRGMRWPRETVYIANILKCRPPNNRDPSPEESACCTPFLQRQIELIQPLMILAVGRVAAQNLLGSEAPIGKLRGVVHHYGPRQTPLIATYHPSYLLRSPGEKRRVWQDMKFLKAELSRLRAAAGSH